jgi:hemoglobin
MFVQVETNANSLYERVGGEPFFTALVERFYAGVEDDPVLRPLYPADLGASIRHLALFLVQYWGGPPTYNAERGHPRLRMRHVRFGIGQAERDAWLRHMRAAVEASDASAADAQAMLAYFEMAATSLMNQAPSAS